MKVPRFTDEQLEHYAENPNRDMTSLEGQLAQTLINTRAALRELKTTIEPLAATSQEGSLYHAQMDLISRLL